MSAKAVLILAGILGALSVGIGAFGAHGLEATLTANGRVDTFETAVKYQFYHTLALLLLGILMLKKGVWNGQEIVPKSWIEALFQTKTSIGSMKYSYWWWQLDFPNNGKNITATFASGNGGQYIMCFPKQNMVIVFTGGAFNSQEQQRPFGIVNNFVLPALK